MVKSGRLAGALSLFFFFASFFFANPAFCVADSSLVTTAPVDLAAVLVVPASDRPEAVKVELHTEPSESVVSQGDKFLLTFKVIYYGSDSYWHVKSIDGPVLKGIVQLSHAVSSIVGRTSEGVICEEVHKLRLEATGSDVGTIGSVAVVLLGKDGAIRHLQSNPVEVRIEPVLFNGYVKLPVLWIIFFAVASVLFLILVVLLKFKSKRVRIAREKDESLIDSSAAAQGARLLLSIDEINSPSAFEDVKTFYKKSLRIIEQGLELNTVSFENGNGESLCEHFQDVPNMSASLESGLKKVVREENLVRFAGFKPSAEECSQVCSRLKEFITLNIDSEL